VQSDGTWAFKTTHGYYVTAQKENEMSAFNRSVDKFEKFAIHLAMHPQSQIYSPPRQSYAHIQANELRANRKMPWGFDAMVSISFDKDKAKYTIRGANNKYWSCDAKFVDALDNNCYYILVLAEAGKMGFRGANGKYITAPTSADSILRCTSTECKTNESFTLEDSHGQITILAGNGKYVSMSRNQDPQVVATKVEDLEIFQMETKDDGKSWVFKTVTERYFAVSPDNNALTTLPTKEPNTYFTVEYSGRDTFIVQNGKYLSYTPQGPMKMISAPDAEYSPFKLDINNRPQLILRSEYGFVTSKRANDQLACNSSDPDTFYVESKGGAVTIKGDNGKYWVLKDDGKIQCNGSAPDEFHFEWRAHTRMAIRAAKSGQYVSGGQQGHFIANSPTITKDSLWEY